MRGKNNSEMKKIIIILFIIIGIPSFLFIRDNNRKSKYENPFAIGKAFAYHYMTKNSEDMKLYSDKKIYEKIDGLNYLAPYNYEHSDLEDVDLVCSRKIWNTIVCTYSYYEYGKNLSFLYSVILKPGELPTLWENTKKFIYFEIPFGDKLISSVLPHKQRWLVVDFFTTDDFENYYITSQKNINDLINQDKIDEFLSTNKKELERSLLIAQKMWDWNNTNEWGKREMIQQNIETKKLYTNIYADILKAISNGNE